MKKIGLSQKPVLGDKERVVSNSHTIDTFSQNDLKNPPIASPSDARSIGLCAKRPSGRWLMLFKKTIRSFVGEHLRMLPPKGGDIAPPLQLPELILNLHQPLGNLRLALGFEPMGVKWLLLLGVLCVLAVRFSTSIPLSAQDTEPESTWGEQVFAPYIMPAYNLTLIANNQGLRHFTLAFILAKGDTCEARFQGTMPLTDNYLQNDLKRLRELGGDVIVSFGGWGGTELAQVCESVQSLTQAYQAVIDTLGVSWLDFDIEGDDIKDPVTIKRRSEAIAALQANAAATDTPLHIGFTLPVLPTGLTEEGLSVLDAAIEAGVEISVVNIMTMNFGEAFPPDKMGANAIQAAESLFTQLQTLYSDKTDADVWGMIGVTPMIGVNDYSVSEFTLSDAEQVAAFAQDKAIRLLTMWSVERDKSCVSGVRTVANNCSGIAQDDFAFSAIFKQFDLITAALAANEG